MKKVVSILLFYLGGIIALFILHQRGDLPAWIYRADLAAKATWTGVMGGVMYCLRATYLNACVKKSWDPDWELWYFLRPLVSGLSGFLSYLFLKAGLIALESHKAPDAGAYGFLAFAFLAGMNVDKFISKVESIFQSLWGIEQSRMTTENRDK